MNTALIIICIAFCVAIILWALVHFGTAITLDKKARERGVAEGSRGTVGGGRATTGGGPTA